MLKESLLKTMILKHLSEFEIAYIVVQSLEEYCKNSVQKKYILMISGGRSPLEVFKKFQNSKIPWSKIDLYWMDERCVPLDHPESNYRLDYESFVEEFLSFGILKPKQIHPILSDASRGDLGVSLNGVLLQNIPEIDFLITGVGEDGHVGSLFPRHEGLQVHEKTLFPVIDSPKIPERRITFSRTVFASAKQAHVLFIGPQKQEALKRFLDPAETVEDCPVKMFQEVTDLYVYSDQIIEN